MGWLQPIINFIWNFILKPALPYIVDMVIKLGKPKIMEWIKDNVPGWLASEKVLNYLYELVLNACEKITGLDLDGDGDVGDAVAIRKEAVALAKECVGTACPPRLVRDK